MERGAEILAKKPEEQRAIFFGPVNNNKTTQEDKELPAQPEAKPLHQTANNVQEEPKPKVSTGPVQASTGPERASTGPARARQPQQMPWIEEQNLKKQLQETKYLLKQENEMRMTASSKGNSSRRHLCTNEL